MSRTKITIEKVEYDLSHLQSRIVIVAAKGGNPERKVLVNFGCHTFTKEFKDGDPNEWAYHENGERRHFCIDRHSHSKELPRIINYTANGRVFFSQGRNLLCVDWLDGLEAPYAVFFNMSKGQRRGISAVMDVVSAYGKPNLPDRLPSITFAMLVNQIAQGKRPKFPDDLRSIRK